MSNKNSDYYFLKGGGEMGKMIRAKDWSKTALGDPGGWSQSLQTMVAVMLDNPFGMYIAWGNEYIQLYNDGYRPILGALKHPKALGISTMDTFSEIWDNIIGSMFDDVMKGKAVGFPDLMLPLNRNGFIEECYFDFSYSPIRKDDGEVGGVLVTVIETTNKKKAEESLKESEENFRSMAEASDILIAVGDETSNAIYFNKAWVKLTGRPMDDLLKFGWVDLVHPDDKERYVNIYLDAFKNKVVFTGEFRVLNKKGEYRWLLAQGPPIFRPDGSFAGYISSAMDITDQKNAIHKTEERKRLYETITQNTPDLIYVFDLSYRFTYANEALLKMWGRSFDDSIGKGMLELGYEPWHAEMHEREIDHVIATKKSVRGEVSFPHATLGERIYDYIFAPVIDQDGKVEAIAGTTRDITPQVEGRKKIEEAEETARLAINSAELGVYEIIYSTNEMITDSRFKEIWGVDKSVTRNEYAAVIHPDDLLQRKMAHEKAIKSGLLDYRARVIWKDKSIHWVRVTGKVIYD